MKASDVGEAEDNYKSSQPINVFVIISNPSEENRDELHNLYNDLYEDPVITEEKCQIFTITIENFERCTLSLTQSNSSSAKTSLSPMLTSFSPNSPWRVQNSMQGCCWKSTLRSSRTSTRPPSLQSIRCGECTW